MYACAAEQKRQALLAASQNILLLTPQRDGDHFTTLYELLLNVQKQLSN
jgi:hypothetical protein